MDEASASAAAVGRRQIDGGAEARGGSSEAAGLDGPVEERQGDRDADVADDDDGRGHDKRDDRVGVVDGCHQVTIDRL